MSGFKVSAKVYLSGDAVPESFVKELTSIADKVWMKGDLVTERSTQKHTESGGYVTLLKESEDVEWIDAVDKKLRSLVEQLNDKRIDVSLIVPQLSLFIETDGDSYPPLFFSNEFLAILNKHKFEIDIDVMNTL